METNQDFKNMWQKQNAQAPNMNEINSKVTKMRRSQLRRILLTNLTLAGTTIFIIFIWIHYQPEMITTKLGIILMVLAMGIFAVLNGQLRPVIKNLDDSKNAHDYIQNLLELKKKQQYIQTTVMNAYFILLSLGIGLYMIEYAGQLPLWGTITCYLVTGLWIAYSWFYLRPRTIRKQQSKIDELIQHFQSIKEQFGE